jgi:uncharacterized protein YqeY
LAKPELDEVAVLEQFLPESLNRTRNRSCGCCSNRQPWMQQECKIWAKLWRIVSKELAGQADGKTISQLVKKNLMK